MGITYLIIGPSGVGKTSVISILKKRLDCVTIILDDYLKKFYNVSHISEYFRTIGNQQFFENSKNVINHIVNTNTSHSYVFVDVGAGSFDWHGCMNYYKSKNIIVLTGKPETLYERGNRQKYHPTLEGYKNSEFSLHKNSIYESALHKIDTTHLSIDDVADKIIFIITYSNISKI